jgi:hypothetical protein
MGRKFRFKKSKKLVVLQLIGKQVVAMKKAFPGFLAKIGADSVSWTGIIQPTTLSDKYTVRIFYSAIGLPKVCVLSPKLVGREDNPFIPHVYPGKRLCLYLPGAGEWTKEMLVNETIVPWTSLWLYYYEVWLATGNWLGGGVHPSANRQKK